MKKSVVILSLLACTLHADNQGNGNGQGQTTPMPNQKNKVMQLQPEWTHGQQSNYKYSLDLNSTNAVYPEIVLKDGDGNPILINYIALIPILVQQIQKLQQQVNDLQS